MKPYQILLLASLALYLLGCLIAFLAYIANSMSDAVILNWEFKKWVKYIFSLEFMIHAFLISTYSWFGLMILYFHAADIYKK